MTVLRSIVLAGTLLACACATPPAPGPTSSAAAPPTPQQQQQPGAPATSAAIVASPSSAAGGQGQPAVDAALREGATHLGISQADLTVQRVEEREWSDASLGCPRQGVLYAQVVTPGFLIVISGGGKELEYHADQRGRVVLCAER